MLKGLEDGRNGSRDPRGRRVILEGSPLFLSVWWRLVRSDCEELLDMV